MKDRSREEEEFFFFCVFPCDKIHEKAPDPNSHDKDGKHTWPSVTGSLTAST